MIQAKLKICSVCNEPSVLWISTPKMCKNCAMRLKSSEKPKFKPLTQTEDGKSAKAFKVYSTKAIKQGKSKTVELLTRKREIDSFFNEQANQVPERCENCNKKLNAFSKWAKRSVTAHILGKADFESVVAHPMNRMFLGVGIFSDCHCHTNWDNSDAANRKTMHCYKIALERSESFYDQLTPHEQNKADKYLGTNENTSQ